MPKSSDETNISTILTALDYLEQGISVFNVELVLIAWNSRFEELLSFPPDFLRNGMSIREIFQFNASRGEYGPGNVQRQVESRVMEALRFEPYRFERIRPNGTVIEISGAPLPQGGMVTTYSDMTWMHKREEELGLRVEERTAELSARTQELDRKKSDLDVVMENIRHGIAYIDRDLKLVICNKSFLELTRFPEEFGTPGTPFESFMRVNAERGEYGPGNIEELVHERSEKARHPVLHRFERIREDGSALEVIGSPVEGGGFVTTFTDITERKRMEKALRDSETQLRGILEASSIGVAVSALDASGVLFCNSRFGEMLQYFPEDMIGKDPSLNYVDASRRHDLVQRILAGGDVMDEEVELQRTDGTSIWVLLTFRRIVFNGTDSLLSWAYDISELRRVRMSLNHLAHHDGLSGLPNRRSFDDSLRRALAISERNGMHGALLFIDLDGFKAVNDNLGHDAGDWLLTEVANRIRASLRPYDIAARLGGDEFAVLIEGIAERKDATTIAEKLCVEIAAPYAFNKKGITIGASIGVAFFGEGQVDADTLLSSADTAMYRAKMNGKGRVVLA
jgi:diguanylate cyclase (GGDEF)-like protein/PAS domain S-box-containing protein